MIDAVMCPYQVVLFRPYYFSHLAAIQLLGLKPVVVDCDESGMPDVRALHAALERPKSNVRVVTLVTPSNPSGAVCDTRRSRELLQLCHERKVWLVADEAYEHFVHEGEPHCSPSSARLHSELAHGVVSLYTFSKSFGLAGWRVGYLSYPAHLHQSFLKVQDTFPTHATVLSQEIAERCVKVLGPSWVQNNVSSLNPARDKLWKAISTAAHISSSNPADLAKATRMQQAIQPRGAFYYLVPLPGHLTEEEAIAILAKRHGLLLLPGMAFGMPGMLRLSYGCLGDADAVYAAACQLEHGLCDLWSCAQSSSSGHTRQ